MLSIIDRIKRFCSFSFCKKNDNEIFGSRKTSDELAAALKVIAKSVSDGRALETKKRLEEIEHLRTLAKKNNVDNGESKSCARFSVRRMPPTSSSTLDNESEGRTRFSISARDETVSFMSEEFSPNSSCGRIAQELQNSISRSTSFVRMLIQFVNDKCEGKSHICYKRAGISRQLYSKVISQTGKNVAKRTVMQLCIGLRLSVDEAESLMNSAGYAFSKTIYEDTVFYWCLENCTYNIFDVNNLLVSCKCNPVTIF